MESLSLIFLATIYAVWHHIYARSVITARTGCITRPLIAGHINTFLALKVFSLCGCQLANGTTVNFAIRMKQTDRTMVARDRATAILIPLSAGMYQAWHAPTTLQITTVSRHE